MVVGTKRRKMISRRKKKTTAQRMLEQMERYGMTQQQVRKNIALSQFGGGTLSPQQQALFDLPPLSRSKIRAEKIKLTQSKISNIPALSIVAKTAKTTIRRQRKRALKGVQAIQEGRLPPSSWIRALEYIETSDGVGNVHADFTKRWYTFKNVPETLFNAWYAGAAATTTTDKSKARRWSINDFPSLGAFFNQRIKGKYSFSRGRV